MIPFHLRFPLSTLIFHARLRPQVHNPGRVRAPSPRDGYGSDILLLMFWPLGNLVPGVIRRGAPR